jgi:hypothetical protein
MNDSEATLKGPGGKEVEQYFIDLARNAQPTEGDALYASQRQRTRILRRTARGVDVDEIPFAPYSENGPYYYYPNGRVGNKKTGQKKNHEAAKRLSKKIGGTVTRNGIKFESYAAFKAAMGRGDVDLRGPRAPHMLQAIAVKTGSSSNLADEEVELTDKPNVVDEAVIGIYGKEAERASGHNQGGRHLPKRRFFGASAADVVAMIQDVTSRVVARLKAATRA